MMTQANPSLTTGQVAKILHLCPRTVQKLIDSGQLKGHRMPSVGRSGYRRRRVLQSDLDQFMRQHGMEALIPCSTPSEC